MAEVGTTAAVIGIAGLAYKISKKISALKEAPAALLAMRSDLDIFRL